MPPRDHGEPLLRNSPPRVTTKTSRCPLVSPGTRLVASDSKAMYRAQRRSPEMAGATESPFAGRPSIAVEITAVLWPWSPAAAAGGTSAAATRASGGGGGGGEGRPAHP